MKKGFLVESIMFLIGGAVLLAIALSTDSVLGSLFFGFASSALCVGIVSVCRYFYWSAPGNVERYRERLANEKIEMHDELKVKLRDRSGRYAYVLGLVTISISIVVFSVLGKLGIVGSSRMLVLYLGGYLIFQIAIGSLIYYHLLRKY